ncbi:MAG: NADH:flavin oxidoreductase/NADH oxidase family protein [Bacteroidota bacterium]
MLTSPLTLPCGAVLKNRLAKAAMTERIGDKAFNPTDDHVRLYKRWADTGTGLLITGNAMITRKYVESAGNVVLDEDSDMNALTDWVDAGKSQGNHLWVQINHAGRQTSILNSFRPLAPSEVKLNKLGLFGKPKAMTEAQIHEVINDFATSARVAKQVGFTGIQIHSAHGYLLSQFLSPHTNLRTDQWGGSLENRSRLLLKVVQATREAVGHDFPVSVKINSADFQRGGFEQEESLAVIQLLAEEKIDLLEVSGGTYEKLVFLTKNSESPSQAESTRKREAYFIDFAKKVRAKVKLPLMITGGFRSFDFCQDVLEGGEIDVVGMGRPFLTNSHEIKEFIEGKVPHLDNLIYKTGIKSFDDLAEGGVNAKQLINLARGEAYNKNVSSMQGFSFFLWYEFYKSLARKLSF